MNYGQVIPSAPHANVVSDTCAGCHMQTIATSDPALRWPSGHSTKMSYTNSLGVEIRWPMSVPSATAPSPILISRLR